MLLAIAGCNEKGSWCFKFLSFFSGSMLTWCQKIFQEDFINKELIAYQSLKQSYIIYLNAAEIEKQIFFYYKLVLEICLLS